MLLTFLPVYNTFYYKACQGSEVYSFRSASGLFGEPINKVNSQLFTVHFMVFCAVRWMGTILNLPASGESRRGCV